MLTSTSIQNLFYLIVGIAFLLLSKVKSALSGYRTPKPFGTAEWMRSANYDITVVDEWLRHLSTYAPTRSVANKNVLELGPGSDIGTGLYLLSKQTSQYVGVDVNNLVSKAPNELYEALFSLISLRNASSIDSLRSELKWSQEGKSQRLRFVHRPEFDLSSCITAGSVDLIFSQAAFEHFDDFNRFATDLTAVAKPGAILIAEVDLQTHSRWIRDKDELNIYRYSDRIYNLLRCPGSPNRLRPFQYKSALQNEGWTDIRILPLTVLDNQRLSSVRGYLAKRFRDDENRMEQLSIVLCATRGAT